MNSRQKEVIAASLDDEKAVLSALEKNYTTALADIKRNIKELQSNPLTQSKAYQLDFQKQLERQISGILDNLSGKTFASIADYLNTCYQTGFVGAMYDLQGQGLSLILPIDQNQVLKAVQKTSDDIKLVNKIGVSTKELKGQVLEELKRGFASDLTYTDIARNISNRGQANMARSMTIARTEGHRVQSEAKMDSYHAAKEKGADIVKQWDATLDGATRDTHRMLDGQVRELDEDFTALGASAPYPGGFGDPAEDCNCRCCMLQRARWAVEEETTYDKWNNETGGIIQCTGYDDFKEKYLKATEQLKKSEKDVIISKTRQTLKIANVEYRAVESLKTTLSESEIIDRLGGGDLTNGSCSSLAFAYTGNQNQLDVLDFRDGASRTIFSSNATINEIANLPGVNGVVLKDYNDFTAVNKLLQTVEVGKDYYLGTGSHAAIIRKVASGYEYLELQSATNNGFHKLTSDVLKKRFGCQKSHTAGGMKMQTSNQLIECESLGKNDEFRKLLGYINTSEGSQVKGVTGYVK